MTQPQAKTIRHEFEDEAGNEIGEDLAKVDITHEVTRTFVDYDEDTDTITFTHRVRIWDSAIELNMMLEGLVHTGMTAFWCAICGDCTCERDTLGACHFDDPTCPLHGTGKEHA